MKITNECKERFVSRCSSPTKSGCIEWLGPLFRDGYGQVKVAGSPRVAHRVSWQISNGEIPCGLFVLHSCDNRKCVNVEHLFLGSHADNMRDRNRKRRQARGWAIRKGVLRDEDINVICRRLHSGETQQFVADDYGISQTNVSLIALGKTWGHVPRDLTGGVIS